MTSTSSQAALDTQLVHACWRSDVHAVAAAIAGGANVNGKASPPGWLSTVGPLWAAVAWPNVDVATVLLSHGADPNGEGVMTAGNSHGTPDVLQLLIDAGGDVNVPERPGSGAGILRVLLAEPAYDLTCSRHTTKPIEREVLFGGLYPALSAMIACEVSPAVWWLNCVARRVALDHSVCFVLFPVWLCCRTEALQRRRRAALVCARP